MKKLKMPSCEKCGNSDIVRSYRPNYKSNVLWYECSRLLHGMAEHMDYHCKDCHYEWDGPVLERV